MVAFILALFAAAPASTPAPNTVSPLTIPAAGKPAPVDATVDMAGDESTGGEFVAVWPRGAYNAGTDGKVILSCKVDTHGLAEWCAVKSETPPDKGFGAAALQMRPTFKLTPAMGAEGPINAVMNIAVNFRAPTRQIDTQDFKASKGGPFGSSVDISHATFLGVPMAMTPVTMLSRPVWSQAPGFDDLAAAYPAKAGGQEGYAVAHCQVLASGELKNCGIVKETPARLGFAQAAMSVTSKFRVIPALAAQRQSKALWVDIPVRLQPPDKLADRTVMAPIFLVGVDPSATPKLFPPEAVAAGLTTGRGIARCTVGAEGALTACAPEPGEPDGLGFSEAAVKIASGLKINLWSADAAPVEGGVIHIPIRLNLKGG